MPSSNGVRIWLVLLFSFRGDPLTAITCKKGSPDRLKEPEGARMTGASRFDYHRPSKEVKDRHPGAPAWGVPIIALRVDAARAESKPCPLACVCFQKL
jgi:hypothetical protein